MLSMIQMTEFRKSNYTFMDPLGMGNNSLENPTTDESDRVTK